MRVLVVEDEIKMASLIRRSTAAHRSSGSSVKTSSRRGGSTIQASSASSSSSWPGPQPAWPANTRARREEVFTEEPDDLWAAVLRRKGRRYALLSTMPPDPSRN